MKPILSKVMLISLVLVFLAAPARADSQLITNGGFETGNLAAWISVTQPGALGGWFVSSSLVTPVSVHLTVGPAGGTFYAVTDEPGGPGSHVLFQSFTVPKTATSVVLSFDMFTNNQFSAICNGGLDYTVPLSQCGRVDILSAAASPFDTGAGVVDNLFSGGSVCTNDQDQGIPCPYITGSSVIGGIGNGYGGIAIIDKLNRYIWV